jgi:transcriptional regulator with XRE-family HTH domain
MGKPQLGKSASTGSARARRVGERVRAQRRFRALSQDELGAAVGVSQRAISDLENGNTQDPGIFFMFAVASALDAPVEALLGDASVVSAQAAVASVSRLRQQLSAIDAGLQAAEAEPSENGRAMQPSSRPGEPIGERMERLELALAQSMAERQALRKDLLLFGHVAREALSLALQLRDFQVRDRSKRGAG